MPLIQFEKLPDDSRCWVFAARLPLDEVDEPRLLAAVDGFLLTWKAHGHALTCAREFTEEHFLAVAVDERASDASGCSIDGLFRVLQKAEEGIGTSMMTSDLIFFRAPGGIITSCTRPQFEAMSAMDEIGGDTAVFDTTLTTVGAYRTRFERKARDSWHRALLKKK